MAKVMLVEDDNNLREIYEARLQAEGYTIVSARDGEEALVIAKQEKPDLVISDVMMPKISGFEMLDIIRNTDGLKEVKVIMLTALGQSDDQQRADKLGADRYLVKSQVTLEDIVKVTHDLLGDTPTPPAAPASEPMAAAATSPVASTTAPVTPPTEPVVASAPPVEPASTTLPAPEPLEPATPAAASSPFSPVEVPSDSEAETTAEPVTSEPVAAASAESSSSQGSVARSTAQEEASVEARIEDFVAGASSEAVLPGAETETATSEPEAALAVEPVAEETPTAEPITVSTPDPTPPAETAADNAATDDKLMADAVNTLVSSTEEAAPVSPTATPITISAAQSGATTSSSAPAEPPAPTVEIDAPPTETVGDGTTIAHKKIIKPIDSVPKQDINVLLAQEVATQTATEPPPPAVVVTSDAPAAATPPLEPGKVDPNSIAL